MTEVVQRIILVQLTLLLLDIYVPKSLSSPYGNIGGSDSIQTKHFVSSSYVSPSTDLQPLAPLWAPSPLKPFTYNSLPKLSGLCVFNFSSAESILRVTSIDCWSTLAPYLANVICCPQYEASLVILLGQSSSYSGMLALNETHASHCISDVEKILESQGSNENLHKICSVGPSNLTGASCPIIDLDKVNSILASSGLPAKCNQVNMTDECCNRICQNAISAASEKLALGNFNMETLSGNPILPNDSASIRDCTNVVLRWLASKLDPSLANRVLRELSSCSLNQACPLVFPDTNEISKECGNQLNNQTSCCAAMETYMSRLQEQSFLTNLQALNCATLLGKKLQSAKISSNVYNLCHINLKDFSPQVDSEGNDLNRQSRITKFTLFYESGCLLPSLPSDVTFDKTSGIGFICDLNDNVAAPWPSGPFVPASSCNKSTSTSILPEIPTATSAQIGLCISKLMLVSLLATSFLL